MNRDYAEQKIRDALKAAKGNAAIARKLVIEWSLDDNKLMHELVAPHIAGIAAHAVDRVMSMKEKKAPPPPKPVRAEKGDEFGMQILKAIALGNPAQFGQESGIPLKKQAASQRHIDAIRKMISKDKPGG